MVSSVRCVRKLFAGNNESAPQHWDVSGFVELNLSRPMYEGPIVRRIDAILHGWNVPSSYGCYVHTSDAIEGDAYLRTTSSFGRLSYDCGSFAAAAIKVRNTLPDGRTGTTFA